MPSLRISKEFNTGTYFVTLTVKNWYYVLDRYGRWDILANSLEWFQKNKKLRIYSFVFMINHLHLIIKSDNTMEFIRDFKKYTCYKIIENIKKYEPTLVHIFQDEEKKIQFWSNNNFPETIESEKFFLQKNKYIISNPVKRIYVMNEEDWYWSSANKFCSLTTDDFYEEW